MGSEVDTKSIMVRTMFGIEDGIGRRRLLDTGDKGIDTLNNLWVSE